MYYCTKCNHSHWYTSKIGIEHLEYRRKETPTPIIEKPKKVEKQTEKVPEQVVAKSGNRFSRFIQGYFKSYRVGVEKFGVWWKIFQLSIWSIVLILIFTALIIFVVFFPRIEMINWSIQ
jgi:hypothetical protein